MTCSAQLLFWILALTEASIDQSEHHGLVSSLSSHALGLFKRLQCRLHGPQDEERPVPWPCVCSSLDASVKVKCARVYPRLLQVMRADEPKECSFMYVLNGDGWAFWVVVFPHSLRSSAI